MSYSSGKAKWLSEEALQIAVKRREAKSKGIVLNETKPYLQREPNFILVLCVCVRARVRAYTYAFVVSGRIFSLMLTVLLLEW